MTTKRGCEHEEETELRRGPWTLEEDTLLIHYIACHGEGRWNHLARCSGLKRTGKSCRLRWLNYLKPDVKRGNLTPEEQILILELHSKWGNRWSRIAQHLPGRTDNEIKNYWRTRVQKQARQLRVDANSDLFRDAVRFFWMPRLAEKVGALQPLKRSLPPPPLPPPPPPPPPSPSSALPGFYNAVQFETCTPSSTAAMAALAHPRIEPKDAFGKMGYGTEAVVLGGGEGSYGLERVIGGEPTLSTPVAGPPSGSSTGDSGFDCTMLDDNWGGDGLWNNMEDQWFHGGIQVNEWGDVI